MSLLNESVEKYLGRKCEIVSDPISNPFSAEARKKIREQFSDSILLVWMDEKTQDGQFMIRFIYLVPHLQFAMFKDKMPAGFYTESIQARSEVLTAKVRGLFGTLPYIGFVDGNGYSVWSKEPSLSLFLNEFEAHGLLPILINWKSKPWLNSKAKLELDGRLKISYPDQQKLKFPIWIGSKIR